MTHPIKSGWKNQTKTLPSLSTASPYHAESSAKDPLGPRYSDTPPSPNTYHSSSPPAPSSLSSQEGSDPVSSSSPSSPCAFFWRRRGRPAAEVTLATSQEYPVVRLERALSFPVLSAVRSSFWAAACLGLWRHRCFYRYGRSESNVRELYLLLFLWRCLCFSCSLCAGCLWGGAWVRQVLLASFFEHEVFEGVFVVFLSGFVEVVHVELYGGRGTCRTKEV